MLHVTNVTFIVNIFHKLPDVPIIVRREWERSAPSICFSFGNNSNAMVSIIFYILNCNFLKVLPCQQTMFNPEDERRVGRYHEI